MKLSKRKNKFFQKRIVKPIFLVFFILLIYTSIVFDIGFFRNIIYSYIYKKFKNDNFIRQENINCDKYDPIFLMGERFKKNPISLCKSKKSNHLCYQISKYNIAKYLKSNME